MKKYSLMICALMLLTTLVMAQPHKDAMPGEVSGSSFDVVSLAIGAVVGIVIGYLLGSRSAKK